MTFPFLVFSTRHCMAIDNCVNPPKKIGYMTVTDNRDLNSSQVQSLVFCILFFKFNINPLSLLPTIFVNCYP